MSYTMTGTIDGLERSEILRQNITMRINKDIDRLHYIENIKIRDIQTEPVKTLDYGGKH